MRLLYLYKTLLYPITTQQLNDHMKEQDENLTTSTGLPENAFRELAADEQFTPVMHPAHDQQEATPYSVGMGLLMAVIFSAAAAYLGLKVGQVFEAAIPIAIIVVGLSNALGKKNALGKLVILISLCCL